MKYMYQCNGKEQFTEIFKSRTPLEIKKKMKSHIERAQCVSRSINSEQSVPRHFAKPNITLFEIRSTKWIIY